MVTSRLNNCWWVHEPLEDWENLTPLRYSGCYRMEWRTPKTLLPHRSGLEDVVHELYEMKLLLETGKQYASSCLPSMLSILQSHRYSFPEKLVHTTVGFCWWTAVFVRDILKGNFPRGTSVHANQFPQSAVFLLSWYYLLLCHLNLATWSTSCLRSCVLLWTPALKHSTHTQASIRLPCSG